MKFKVYSNYRCPFAYRAARWLYELKEQGVDIEPEFGFFSLTQNNNKNKEWYVWEEPQINLHWQSDKRMRGLRAHWAAEAARAQGANAFKRFHFALFRAIQEEHLSLTKGVATRHAAEVAELNMADWEAECDNFAHLERLREDHQWAVGKRIFGTPTFVFEGAEPVYVKLSALLPSEEAQAYWDEIQKMAVARPLLVEFKRP